MPRTIRLLLIEDDDLDAELLQRELTRAGFRLECRRVQDLPGLHEALLDGDFDLIISDFNLIGCDGIATLDLVRQYHSDLPFILVSGAIGEEAAARIMRAGAQDYVLKDNLTRLGAAVARELEEAEHRRARRQAEKLLMEAQKLEAVGTLAGGIAHDVGHLLTAILAHAHQLEKAVPIGHPQRPAMDGIAQACERGRDLIRRLLATCRGRADSSELVEVDLPGLFQEVGSLLRSGLPAGIMLRIETPLDLPMVLGDPGQLHQVLVNLATNAWHAMGDRGTLSLVAEPVDLAAGEVAGLAPGHHVRILVRDTGSGMDTTTLARLFEPFFTTKASGKGSGLGLAVVRNVIAAHRGAIQVDSAPGAGTEFRILLPCHEGGTGRRGRSGPIPLGEGREVLIVDDEPLIAGLAQQLLVAAGWRASAIHHPTEALALIAADQTRFACIVIDRQMPEMLGDELAERIAGLAPRLPVVVVSGDDPQELLGQPGIVGVLGKPYTPAELARAVARAARSGPR